MKLIDVKAFKSGNLQLWSFIGVDIPPYAILSHTWEDEEVVFADVHNGTANQKAGFKKIKGCCDRADQDGFEWVWIDTCCIDQSSSAELSEAINSMYRWYKDATICYAYLSDISASPNTIYIEESRWFKRGWTLQELIAPAVVEFYSSDWESLGTKSILSTQIANRTGIPIRILRGDPPSTCIVAERMSWASSRETTRVEDTAYCLMGLFSVNMPLLYGEGVKAFRRLQEQILMQEEDYSIFAWTSRTDTHRVFRGILASSPSQYQKAKGTPSGLVKKGISPKVWSSTWWRSYEDFTFIHPCDVDEMGLHQASLSHKASNPPQVTSRGIRLQLLSRISTDSNIPSFAWLYCRERLTDRLVCISMDEVKPSIYARHFPESVILVESKEFQNFEIRDIFFVPDGRFTISKRQNETVMEALYLEDSKWTITAIRCLSDNVTITKTCSRLPQTRKPSAQLRYISKDCVGGVVFFQARLQGKRTHSHNIRVLVGIFNSRPWCRVLESTDYPRSISIRKLYSTSNRSIDPTSMTDRSAVSFDNTIDVFTSIRRAPSSSSDHYKCILEIQVYPTSKRDADRN